MFRELIRSHDSDESAYLTTLINLCVQKQNFFVDRYYTEHFFLQLKARGENVSNKR